MIDDDDDDDEEEEEDGDDEDDDDDAYGDDAPNMDSGKVPDVADMLSFYLRGWGWGWRVDTDLPSFRAAISQILSSLLFGHDPQPALPPRLIRLNHFC